MSLSFTPNSLGRSVPTTVPGLGHFEPYKGAFKWIHSQLPPLTIPSSRLSAPRRNKIATLRQAIENSGLEDGMTISFHHHLRNGDQVMPLVLSELEAMGFKNLTLAPSSLPDSHDLVVTQAIRSGLISRLYTSGLRGELGRAISRGELEIPVIIRSHGGRARAVEQGDIAIDVAFMAAPACDCQGNMTGCAGPSACGSFGYAMVDSRHARHVIALTDYLVDYPLRPHISVPQYLVDQVVVVDSIGDASKIATGAARITRNPVDLRIAQNAYDIISASGLLSDGCSFQVGVGGASLAVAAYVRDAMKAQSIAGSFGLGGISGFMTDMLEGGHFKALFDVQSFDAAVTGSMASNPAHMEIDASCYANPFNRGCIVHNLDVVVLAALEVDLDFHVNVQTGHDGVLRGAVGGHPDTAAGAKLSVVVLPSFRGGVPSIKDRVTTICTPGETVDVIVTERGISINPLRTDLAEAAKNAGLPLRDLGQLKADVEKLTGIPQQPEVDTSHLVAIVEYRDGTLLDSVYRVPGL